MNTTTFSLRRILGRALAFCCALAPVAIWSADDWKARVEALRPADAGAGETAVLDRVEARAAELLGALHHASSPAEAERARPILRAKLRASLGIDRLPRGSEPPRIVGSVARPGFRIEKIVLQPLAGMRVPAHLYVPDGVRGRAPAVLFYVGHWWPDSKTRPDFQAFCTNMARLGFVVLTWDPFGQGERGISSRDHRRVEALLAGVAQQGFAERETRAALDYLLSRPEVDPKRIGMTGASGGGYNTWITSALDDRIAVAVPVVGTSEFLEQIHVTRPLDWYHAAEHCHFVPALIRYANNHELAAMISPRPLLIVAAARDQSFPIEGVRRVADYGRMLYSASGAAEKFGLIEDAAEGHGYQKAKREAAYGWFRRWLQGAGEGRPYPEPLTEVPPFDAPELRVFEQNQPAGPAMVETARRLADALARGRLRLEEVLGVTNPVPPRRIARPPANPARFIVPAQDGLEIPGFLLRPQGAERGLLLAVDDRGKEAAVSDLPVDEILARGWAVAGVDPRGIGELRTTQMGWVAAVALLAGESFAGRQALDLATAAAALAPASIAVYARGPNATLAATYLLGLGTRVRLFILRDGFATHRHFLERPESLPLSFRLQVEDRDRTTAFDREIPFAFVPFRALEGPDLPDLWRGAKADGLLLDPIDGDWRPLDSATAAKLAPRRVRVAFANDIGPSLAEFLRNMQR